MANKPDDLAGTQRAAILLMSLGEQDAANVLKQLDAREVQKLGIAMAELKEVSREQMTSVLDKFIGIADSKANMAGGSQDFVRRVLTQAVGKQKTDMLLDRVTTGQTGQGIEALKWMEAKAVAQIISGEHPQIAAIVLVASRTRTGRRHSAAADRGHAYRGLDAHRHAERSAAVGADRTRPAGREAGQCGASHDAAPHRRRAHGRPIS